MSFRRRGSFARTLKSLEPEYTEYQADQGRTAYEKNQWFFEIAWEVANKSKFKKEYIMYLYTTQLHTHKSLSVFVRIPLPLTGEKYVKMQPDYPQHIHFDIMDSECF